jgi:hypothetical protein
MVWTNESSTFNSLEEINKRGTLQKEEGVTIRDIMTKSNDKNMDTYTVWSILAI